VRAVGIDASTVFMGFHIDGLGSLSTGLDCFSSSLVVECCGFSNMTNTAVKCSGGGAGTIRRSAFDTNQSALTCMDSSAPIVESSTFENSSFAHVLSFGDPGPTLGGSPTASNDFMSHGVYAVWHTGPSPLAAEYNYWGDDCVEGAWFNGLVDCVPWTDSTHSDIFTECWADVPESEVPRAAYASHSYPNPSNPRTSIAFGLPEPGGAVSLCVYSAGGKLVRTLVDRSMPPGRYVAEWDGEDDTGESVSSGVYFYRVAVPGFESQGKIVLLR